MWMWREGIPEKNSSEPQVSVGFHQMDMYIKVKECSPGSTDLLYNTEPRVNNTVLCALKNRRAYLMISP